MGMISVKTSAKWTNVKNIFGSYNEPLLLQVEIHNGTSQSQAIQQICISLKTLFCHKDVLVSKKYDIISPNENKKYDIDVRHIINQYKHNKRFTVKVRVNNNYYESEKISVKFFSDLNDSLR